MKKKRNRAKADRAHGQDLIEVIIETPKGSRNKIKYDTTTRRLKLSKVLPEGMAFPYDFGFVPSTQAEDGDPVDVLVLTDEPLFPGCAVKCTLIGVIEAKQRDNGHTNRNDRLIAAAEQSINYSDVRSLADLNPKVLRQIDAFFVNYQKVRGIDFTVLSHGGSRKAYKILHKATNL